MGVEEFLSMIFETHELIYLHVSLQVKLSSLVVTSGQSFNTLVSGSTLHIDCCLQLPPSHKKESSRL